MGHTCYGFCPVCSRAVRMPIARTQIRRGDRRRPLSVQIYEVLRSKITTGRLRVGDTVPSNRDLAAHLGVSVVTVTRAYALLEGDGLVMSTPGMLRQVRGIPPVRVTSTERYADEIRRLRAGKYDTEPSAAICRDFGIDWDEYTVEVSTEAQRASELHVKRLHLASRRARVQRRVFVEYARGVPIRTRVSVMPAKLVGDAPFLDPAAQPWPGGTLGELASLDIWVTRVRELVQVGLATDWQAEQLHLPRGAPIVTTGRTFWVDQIPVEFSEVTTPTHGTQLEFDVRLNVD